MDWSGCELVEIVPGKLSGVPILKGSRVQADSIVENAESGESVDDIAQRLRPRTKPQTPPESQS